jgi:regulator of sirC expression with transglutaminase-like and TPR domain
MQSTLLRRAERVAALAHTDCPGGAALEIAGFAYPDLVPERWLDRFDELAGRVEGVDHLALRRVIAIAEGIGGNVEDYYAPDNSFLNRVLETRRGIPISLSILWIEVGRRAGIDVAGIGLPGHFVVSVAGQLVDPFHYGEAIGSDEAASLVASALGGPPRLDRSWLSPVDTNEIIRRLLRNLESIYRERGVPSSLLWARTCLELI